MTQKTIDEKNPQSMGISCYVKCTSNKIDTAKENVRSINLNFDIRVGDKLVGKGNNLNINNIYPEDYADLCKAFGVQDIDENTPFYADLMTLLTQERKAAWSTAMERKEKKIDKDQADVTKDPDAITERQANLIGDMRKKSPEHDKVAKSFCDKLSLDGEAMLNKEQALKLIVELKKVEEKGEAPAKEPAKKKAAKNK